MIRLIESLSTGVPEWMRNHKNLLKALDRIGADLTVVDVYPQTVTSSKSPILTAPNTVLIFKMTKDGRGCYVTFNGRTLLGNVYEKYSWKSILDACDNTVYCIDMANKSNQKNASKRNTRMGNNEDYYSDVYSGESSGDTTKYRHPDMAGTENFDKSGYRKRTLTYWMDRLNNISDVADFNAGTFMKLLSRYYTQVKSVGSRIKSYITNADPMEISSGDTSALLRRYKALLHKYDVISEDVDELIHTNETSSISDRTVDQLNRKIRRITRDINDQLVEINKIFDQID